MIEIYRFKEVCSREKLLRQKPQVLARTWDGEQSSVLQEYILAIDPEYIYLVGFWPQDADFEASLAAGSFHEGLWQRDVLELFLKDDENGEYQEFNLSPAGAWWTAVFSEPRVEKGEGREEGRVEQFSESAVCYLQSESVIGDQQSESALSNPQSAENRLFPNTHCAILKISRNELGVKAAFNDRTRINVTACIRGSEGERIYLSAAKLAGIVPDFHQPGCFGVVLK